ncbi:hypothetical protein F5X98DRAFT_290948 [Xylaria grammica]|nr:hypothetical protein F5X98DRAFT_290948 [Xylaria grammica]
MMKLVDEKKSLTEISNLRKQRKNFAQFDSSQKAIDDLKAKIKEIKDGMDDPDSRALSERYSKVQGELDSIKAEQDEAFKNLNSLRDERSKLQAEQQEKFQAVRKLKDEYYAAKKAFGEYEREARQKARERQKAERERYDKEKKKERAQKMLQDASDPAYLEEIRRANSLLHFFDPSSASTEKAPLLADSGLTAQASRKVDDSGLKGTKLVRKEDREEDFFPAIKKGKKGKKSAPVEKSGFNCPPSVIDDCGFLGLEPPMSAADVSAIIEKIKAKLDHWKSDQQAETQRVGRLNNFFTLVTTSLTISRTLRRRRRRSRNWRLRKPRKDPEPRLPTVPTGIRPTLKSRLLPRTSKMLRWRRRSSASPNSNQSEARQLKPEEKSATEMNGSETTRILPPTLCCGATTSHLGLTHTLLSSPMSRK